MMKVIRHRKQIRLRDYDYSLPGAYFITVCTKGREESLGAIVAGEARLNEKGKIVHACWQGIETHFQYVVADEFIVMPNHVHGIVIILDSAFVGSTSCRPPSGGVRGPDPYKGHPTLSNIVAFYKYQSTKQLNALVHSLPKPLWQRGFYEHVIRDDRSLRRIREYIRTNPERWTHDRENRERVGADEFDQWLQSFPRPPREKSG